MGFRGRELASVLALLLAAMGAAAQQPVSVKPGEDMSDDPEAERRLTDLPAGFEMQLVAAEPAVINPISMNFDPQGRLWVACAPRYPQLLPGQEPADFIVVLDNLDPRGKARWAHVFADGLTVPTGLAPGDGGVYVGQADSLVHLRDSKGTGKADQRRVVLAGFGTQDTHHTLNTFRWGPDGALYFNQGVYIKSTVETPFGPRRLFGGCTWQLRTDRLRLEVWDRSILDNNTWGHVFDPWGQSFLCSAWPDGINLVLPDSPLQKSQDRALVPPLTLTRIGGGRHCGMEIVSGRHFPPDWQGDLLTGDFLTHRVQRYRLVDDGKRFATAPQPPLAVSRHRKFRPVDIKMGPDGAVYIADLYQEIIQHNQVNFRDPRRDHKHGRIWRIVRKDQPLVPRPKLVGVPIAQVLEHLKDPEQWTRQQAKRALAERDRKEVVAGLAAWVGQLKSAEPGLEHHLLEALWTYQSIDEVNAPLLQRLLRSDDFRIRAAATRVLGAWAERLDGATRLIAGLATDPQPRVRLEAVQAAGHIPSAAAAEAALRALDQPLDPLIDFALRRTVALLRPYWYPEFQAGRLTFGGHARPLTFALQVARAPDALPVLTDLLAKGKVPRAGRADVVILLASLGDASHQALALDEALAPDRLGAAERARVLNALRQAARERSVRPNNDLGRLIDLFGHDDARLSVSAMRLAGTWKLEALRPDFNRIAADPSTAEERRSAAVRALVDLGGPESVRQLEALSAADRPFAVRAEALAGLAILDVRRGAALAAPLLGQPVGPGQDPSNLFAAFLHRAGGQAALAAVLKQRPPSADAARIGLRVLTGLGVQAPDLAAVLQSAAGEVGKARKLDAAEMRRLLALVQKQGDAARGERIFRREQLSCLKCHAIAGAGSNVGPDLATVGSSGPVDYLIESILLPSKVVKDGYTTTLVVLKDGRAIAGILQRESPRELVLRESGRDEKIVIPTAAIEERTTGGSLMPEGLDRTLTDAELADLVRFLSELGKPGPYALSNLPVARRWQYLANVPPALLALNDGAFGKALLETAPAAWTVSYSLVSGDLPLGELVRAKETATIVRCQVEVAAAGKLQLVLKDAQGLKLWVDGRVMPTGQRVGVNLTKGLHNVDVRIDLARRKDSNLRCELSIPPGSPAQAAFVAGR
jgi:putative heme-binding domain-containing protein